MSDSIAHYDDLVEELKSEHRALLLAFREVKESSDTADGVRFQQALLHFKALLVPHVVKEAVKVYTYLRQQYKARADHDTYQKINGYKAEMSGIGDAAIRFIDTWSGVPAQSIDFAQVRSTLRDIGALLGDRIRREESDLYPLYHTTH